MAEYVKFPGFTQTEIKTDLDRHLEDIQIRGFSVMERVLSPQECERLRSLLEQAHARQEKEYGIERLNRLGERFQHRGLVAEDAAFRDLITDSRIWPVVAATVGETAILNHQNSSLAAPGEANAQTRYHRDFAKDFVSTRPLCLNVFWCISDFYAENGATWVVPGTHQRPEFPSEKFLDSNAIQILAPAGSVLFFDSLLVHKAGTNKTFQARWGINCMYTRPFIKQQINFPEFMKGKVEMESKLAQTLGFWAVSPRSPQEFRSEPRTYRPGQG